MSPSENPLSSSTTQPPGEVIHQKSTLRTSFNIWTVPDIPRDAIIVAAAAPDFETASPKQDGWMISDMYAFNYLLKKASSNQTWLAVNTEQQLLDKYGDYLHGSPFKIRKVVLSQELLDAGEVTRAEVVSPERMIETVIERVKKACEEAKKKGLPVILFFFAHGVATYNILLNAEDSDRGLTIPQLQQAINPEVSVTIVTNACYSGGWTITPHLSTTFCAAVDAHRISYSWPKSDSIGRRVGGSVFASTMIKSLCDASGPLAQDGDLTDQLDNLQLHAFNSAQGSASTLDFSHPPQQSNLTTQQTGTLNAFIHVINKTLRTEMSQSCRHQFHFSAQSDEWEKSWIKRMGFPLSKFGERWDRLEDYQGPQYQAKLKGGRSYTDEDPDNPDYSDGVWQALADNDWREDSSSEGESGHSGTSTGHSMRVHTFRLPPGGIRRLQFQAKKMIENCPGDWTGGNQTALHGKLEEFIEMPNPVHAYEIFQILKFRETAMEYADFLLATFGINPAFMSTHCLDWNDDFWLNAATARKIPRKKFDMVELELLRRGCQLCPTKEQGPPFHRPLRYIAASLVNADLSKEETFEKIHKIAEFMAKDIKVTTQNLWQQERVNEIGKKWRSTRGWDKVKRTLRRPLT